jgi:hypothetical protein
MLKQTIVWTALPHRSNGPLEAGTKLRISAFVAPRLWIKDDPSITTMQLIDFPDFRDWPKTLAGATFEVAFEGGPTLPATIVKAPRPPRSDLWNSLFKDGTLVIPFGFEDLTGAELPSFSSTRINDKIREVFQRAATTYSVDLPHRSVLANDPVLIDIARPRDPQKTYIPEKNDTGPVFVGTHGPEDPGPDVVPVPDGGTVTGKGCAGCTGCLAAPWALLRRLLKRLGLLAALPFTMGGFGSGSIPSGVSETGGSGGGSSPASLSPTNAEFERLQAFAKAPSETSVKMPEENDLTATYDFHQMVSSLGDYPNLLRYFGLVVDLDVTIGAVLPPATGMLSVIPTLPLSMVTTNYTPRTHYELGDGVFLTQSRPGSDLSNGLLRADDTSRFRVLQLDVAGSGIKMQSTATTIVSQETLHEWAGNEPEEQGLPYLQTAGISLVRPELAVGLKASFFNSWALNARLAAADGSPSAAPAGPEPEVTDEIWAEDALRGYRVDVFDDQSKQWHPLCHRIGKYTFDDAPGGTLELKDEEDEGFVQLAVTEPLKQLPGKRELRVHESLFTWNGWSLAAPRYGNTILPTKGDEETKVGAPPNAPATQFKLTTAFVPKAKSLPRLRFGYRYKLRARVVDLAGNSIFDPSDGVAFGVTQAEVTKEEKFRRFEPVGPPMVMLQREPVEGESLERLVVRSLFDNTPAPVTVPTSVRHFVPPKTSQLMAERHRKFDGTPAVDGTIDGYKLAAREAGTLMETVDPLSGARTPIPGADEVKAPLPADSDSKTPPPHTYWLQRNDAFELPYLPDPYARGVLLTGLPGEVSHRITFEGKWPHPKPFRLRVEGIAENAAPAPPKWDPPADAATSGVLTVEVPQGQTFEVRISSWFNDSDLDNMAIWGWTEETGVKNLNELRGQAADGFNWLHLPFRTLVLVHAVQQPLLIPDIKTVAAGKLVIGDTVATLTGEVLADAKSTEKIDLQASWNDPIDDPALPEPVSVTHTVLLAELRVEPKDDHVILDGVRHPFGDTKHHHVNYSPSGSTRFREYFPLGITKDPENLVRPTKTEAATTLDAHADNSTRPDAPKPLYALPLFEWKRTGGGTLFHASRRGAGLRVYMDRPWYSSGEGELLGVALRPPAVGIGSSKAEALKKYTSEWGMDPLWSSTQTAALATGDFIGDPESISGLPLAELEGAVVDVVGYTPEFDPERKLWFCDILLDPKTAYFPMIRLALVRFQPHSLPGAHISNVVLADFVQVVPHRDVDYDTADPKQIKITVNGPSYAAPPSMIVRLEKPSGIGSGDELGWTPFATSVLRVVDPTPEHTVWQGNISADGQPSPIRIVVLEVEAHSVDGISQVDILGISGAQQAGLSNSRLDLRVTFADSLTI